MRQKLDLPGSKLGAYLYQQYADDDDLQGLIDAQNTAAQYFLDWFNEVDLPYYPSLQGGLLDWVANGLYGQHRTQLASQLSPALGPFNTEAFNADVFNGGTPSSQTFYDLTDDVFQRILTWNFFKGDGRHFSIRWLKRRIMRFLVGANGIDPQPSLAGFTVGSETTSSVGVVIASGAVTVSLDQSMLSLQAGVVPGILQLFKLAFEGGTLELPLGYTYAVSIITGFDALAQPNTLTSSGTQTTQTTAPTTVVVLGGTGLYTYVWAIRVAGLGGVAAVTSAAAASLSTSLPLAGVAVAAASAQGQLSGTMGGNASASSAAAGALRTGATMAGVAIVASGASATFAGGAQIIIDSPLAAQTTFTAKGLAWGQTITVIAVCTVTDTVSGLTTQATCTVTFTCVMPNQLLIEGSALSILSEGGIPIVIEP